MKKKQFINFMRLMRSAGFIFIRNSWTEYLKDQARIRTNTVLKLNYQNGQEITAKSI